MSHEEEVEERIVDLYEKGQWMEVVELEPSRNSFLPWIWPEREDLEFIGGCVREVAGKALLSSIGCGSGLLEWLVHMSTGIEVRGIELDRSWWTSRYAKKFIPMTFVEESDGAHELASSPDAVLLFCYFNNEKAFMRYMEAFKGNCFIVIGPGPGKFTYTFPEPLNLPEGLEGDWKMACRREIRDKNDHIVAYVRRQELRACT